MKERLILSAPMVEALADGLDFGNLPTSSEYWKDVFGIRFHYFHAEVPKKPRFDGSYPSSDPTKGRLVSTLASRQIDADRVEVAATFVFDDGEHADAGSKAQGRRRAVGRLLRGRGKVRILTVTEFVEGLRNGTILSYWPASRRNLGVAFGVYRPRRVGFLMTSASEQ